MPTTKAAVSRAAAASISKSGTTRCMRIVSEMREGEKDRARVRTLTASLFPGDCVASMYGECSRALSSLGRSPFLMRGCHARCFPDLQNTARCLRWVIDNATFRRKIKTSWPL